MPLPSLLATHFMLVSCMAYSLILKMEAICSSKTLVDLYLPHRDNTHRELLLYNKIILILANMYFLLLGNNTT
jgi:hypothetical protein